MKQFFCALLLGLCATTVHAGPVINIGPMYDYMAGDKSTYLKRVYNGGDATAFVRINIYEMLFDADGSVKEVPLDTDGPVTQRKGLVASPARLIVPAKGMQATRLVFMGERDQERYYRVRFVPVVPEKEDQFAVSDEDRESYKTSMSAGVNIMTGYGAIFFVRPKDTRFDSQVTDSPAKYQIKNAGNSTIVLDEFKDCSIKTTSECSATRKQHVRPGKTFSFEKTAGRSYRFNLVEGDKSKAVEVR